MNDNKNGIDRNDDIDLVDFSANREMDRIRENERIEREKRRRRVEEMRRHELLKKKKQQRLQQMIVGWGIIALVVLALIAVIIGVVSLFRNDDEAEESPVGNVVSEEEIKTVSEFSQDESVVYVKRFGSEYKKLIENITLKAAAEENPVSMNGELSMYADAYFWNSGFGEIDDIKALVLDTPVLNNGYVWTESDSMRSTLSKSYHYDTHAAFIKAVCNICLWESDTSFLSEIDPKSVSEKDMSAGKSVRQKLQNAVDYFFVTDPYAGGIRYNEKDGLVYIKTAANDGTPEGKASNIFYTYKFGYLDCYNNLLFYDAMRSLSHLYKLDGDEENSKKFEEIAEKNKEAINKTFYDTQKGRYMGYIDIDGKVRDNGFTAINLMAVSFGVADDVASEKIMAWVNEEGRASSGIFPSFSTVKVTDAVWDTIGGKYITTEEENYGSIWLNGGRSSIAAYYYLGACKAMGEKYLTEYLSKLERGMENGSLKLPGSDSENTEPLLYYGLLSGTAVKEFFGISTDGKILTLNPVFGLGEIVGIKNIAFAEKNYDVLFDNETVYILSDTESSVKIRIGGYEKNCQLVLSVVKDGKILSSESVKADKSGNFILSKKFGDASYVKIEIAYETE